MENLAKYVDRIKWSYSKYEPSEDEYNTVEEYNDLLYKNSIFSLECFNEDKGIHFHADVNREELSLLFDDDYILSIIDQQLSDGDMSGLVIDIQDRYLTPKDINDADEIISIAKRIYPVCSYKYPFRGFLLTDGTLLHLGTSLHDSISKIKGMTPGKFISLGNIRIGTNYIELEQRPNSHQILVLSKMIHALGDHSITVEIVKYNENDKKIETITSKEYVFPKVYDVINGIDRYFDEGIKLYESVNKEHQLRTILSSNPMHDDIHTGIRAIGDIKEYGETLIDKAEIITTPDFSFNDSLIALQSGKIRIYSSYSIKNGTFVTPSYMIAKDYSGNSKVYAKTVDLDEVAWINNIEGQYTGKDINEECGSIIAEEISAADEIIKNNKLNFHSFEVKDELCKDIFDSECTMRSDIRNEIIKVVTDIFGEIGVLYDYMVDDIVLIGSLASYHYSSYSDFDLHFIVDMSQVNDDVEAARDILDDFKREWNENNKLTVGGYEIEIYFNDINDKFITNGIYSIVKNGWVKNPEKENYVIDRDKIEEKSLDYISKIIGLRNGEEKAEDLWQTIKKKRKSALAELGEFAEDNIIFKILRRTGYLEKLKNKRPRKKKDVIMVDDVFK